MYSVKTLNAIASVGTSQLPADKYTVSADAENPDAILVRSAKMHDMVFNKELLCIARAGAGVNNIPLQRCAEEGIVVFNTPGANANAVKELAIAAILMASRDIAGGIKWASGLTENVAAEVEKGKSAFVGPEIAGKSLGVIGLGAVGAKIANAALALGMKVYGYDPYLSVDAAWSLSAGIIHATDTDTVYANCDYITLHVPYLESTHHPVNAESIAKMKDGVRIINLARGELVCDEDILAAIESGKVARYVTDFPNESLINKPGVVALPHLGASTPESEDNCAVMAAKEIMDYLENGNIVNSVNLPRAVLPKGGFPRLCVIHKNIPDMIAKVTSTVSSHNVNIENMISSSQKGNPYAYTILDINSAPENIAEDISAIDGIARARLIDC